MPAVGLPQRVPPRLPGSMGQIKAEVAFVCMAPLWPLDKKSKILNDLFNTFHDLPSSNHKASALTSSSLPPTPLQTPTRHSCNLFLKSLDNLCIDCFLLFQNSLSLLFFFPPSSHDQVQLSSRKSSLTFPSPLRLFPRLRPAPVYAKA